MEIKISINTKPRIIHRSKMANRAYRNYSGVYIMYDISDVCLYVGKTVNLYNRLGSHGNKSDFYNEIEYIKFIPISNEYEKDIAETHLIYELKPLHNKAKTYYHQSDYEVMLEEIVSEIEEIEGEIEYREFYLYEDAVDSEVIDVVNYDEQFDDISSAEEEIEINVLRNRRNVLLDRRRRILHRMSL